MLLPGLFRSLSRLHLNTDVWQNPSSIPEVPTGSSRRQRLLENLTSVSARWFSSLTISQGSLLLLPTLLPASCSSVSGSCSRPEEEEEEFEEGLGAGIPTNSSSTSRCPPWWSSSICCLLLWRRCVQSLKPSSSSRDGELLGFRLLWRKGRHRSPGASPHLLLHLSHHLTKHRRRISEVHIYGLHEVGISNGREVVDSIHPHPDRACFP